MFWRILTEMNQNQSLSLKPHLLFCIFLVCFSTHLHSQDRREISFSLQELSRFKIDLFEPRKISLIEDKKFLISGDDNLVIFNQTTQQLTSLRNNRDWKGLGEGIIQSVEIENEFYHIIHNMDGKIRKYTLEGDKEVYAHKPYEGLSRGIYIGNKNYLITHEQKEKDWTYKFAVYNVDADKTTRSYYFSDLIKEKYNETYEEECMVYVFGGYMTSNQNYTFYVSRKTSLFLAFDKQGELLYIGEGIYGKSLPKVKSRKFLGYQTCDLTPDVWRMRDAANDDNYLYILSNIRDKDKSGNHIAIDIYQTNDGRYLGSSLVPHLNDNPEILPKKIGISPGKMYIIYAGGSIVEYKIERDI